MFSSVIGVLASINTGGAPVYFTTALYPIVITDSMAIISPSNSSGTLWQSLFVDNVSFPPPSIVSATLDVTLNPVATNILIDNVSFPPPSIVSATLDVVLSFVTYDNPLALDTMSVPAPLIQSGTLA